MPNAADSPRVRSTSPLVRVEKDKLPFAQLPVVVQQHLAELWRHFAVGVHVHALVDVVRQPVERDKFSFLERGQTRTEYFGKDAVSV